MDILPLNTNIDNSNDSINSLLERLKKDGELYIEILESEIDDPNIPFNDDRNVSNKNEKHRRWNLLMKFYDVETTYIESDIVDNDIKHIIKYKIKRNKKDKNKNK